MPRFFLSFLMFMLVFPSIASSEIEIGGYIKTDNRIRLQDGNKFTWNENQLDLKAEVTPSEKTHLFGEFMLRGFGLPQIAETKDLQRKDKDKALPWAIEFKEAYIDFYGFLLTNLDLRIGRQRIAWGTADELNPTDNLNPDDFEDIWDFGKKLGTNSLKATYYLGDFTLTGVFIPIFTPAVLPDSDWASALSPSMSIPEGLKIQKISDQIILPENNPKKGSMGAVKVAKSFFNYDFSLSYFYGRDDLPLIDQVSIEPVDTLGSVNVHTKLCYPRMQVVGLDMAGAIGDVGIWAEGALFIPEKVEMTTIIPTQSGMVSQKSTALKDQGYFKYVVGGDYTFKNGLYVNGQFLHGFYHEREKDNLEDYLMLGFEKKFLNDELKITLAGGAEIKEFDDLKDNYATIIFPEISYYPLDNTEILLGVYLIDGKETTNFGRVKENDEGYIKAKYSF